VIEQGNAESTVGQKTWPHFLHSSWLLRDL